ncbi:serine/threonine-protein kinase [Nonomuraea maritima]|uniref:serine/threonine-protein kinase n=1 Tax=Nonomuraea maritima TaxID=683260 RepID=UPI003711625E
MLGAGTILIDRYVLGDRLGGGGMGEVWRADDTVLGRTVAVKVLMPALTDDAAFTRRFKNEARAMATLRHPGVVDVYDYGTCEVEGRPVTFLVMEHVRGESLDRVLRRGPLDVATTMRLVAEVADALSAAHAQGIVHRDVKPANLMVRPDGHVALTDFGIAHSASAANLTATGTMLCSAGYCAPEMAASSEVTPAVDVYALGVVAYECLTGQLPYQGDTPVQIIFKHLNAPVPRLPGDVPGGPRQVVERALEKTPATRWPSAPAMAEAARRALAAPDGAGSLTHHVPAAPGDPGLTTVASAEPTLPAPRRRRTMRAALTMAAAVAVSAAVAGSVWLRPAEPTTGADVTNPPAVSGTTREPSPTASVPVRRQSPPAAKRSSSPRATEGTPTPTPTVSVPATPPVTTTPQPSPTTSEPAPDPEPTQQPSPPPSPNPDEPTAEPTSVPPQSELQCVRSPCP